MTAICQKKNKGMRAWLRKNAVGYAFLMPFLVLFAIFVIVPVGVAMYYSLTNYNMIQAPKFVGLSNYAQLILDDDVFLISLKNTLLLAVVTGPLGYFASFLMAWIITLVKKGRGFFSMAFYAPSLTSGVAMSTIWLILRRPLRLHQQPAPALRHHHGADSVDEGCGLRPAGHHDYHHLDEYGQRLPVLPRGLPEH